MLLGNSVLVDSKKFPKIDNLANLACQRLGEEKPRVHIVQNPYINAFAIGFGTPFSIIINSATIKHLDEDELLFVIGHELGHIKSRHTKWLSIISPLGKDIAVFNLIFGFWKRKAELTCDRAGLIVCRKLDAAIRAMIKLSSGPDALDNVDLRAFLEQASEVDSSSLDKAGELLLDHPYLINRIRRIIEFAHSKAYSDIVGENVTPSIKKGEKICPSCGQIELNYEFAFCRYCGTPLLDKKMMTNAKRICKNCGNSIETEWTFCPSCGSKV